MIAHSKVAVVLVDPYNDFLHPEGKLTSALTDLEERGTVKHIKHLISVARTHQIPIYYGLHHQWTENSFDGWKHLSKNNKKQQDRHYFQEGTFGAQILPGMEPDKSNGDVVVSRHWNSDSFEHTDLDHQLRQREKTHLVLGGLTANTCLESTARKAFELGYHVTLLKDATAGWSKELTETAINLVWPLFAERVMTVEEWAASLSSEKL